MPCFNLRIKENFFSSAWLALAMAFIIIFEGSPKAIAEEANGEEKIEEAPRIVEISPLVLQNSQTQDVLAPEPVTPASINPEATISNSYSDSLSTPNTYQVTASIGTGITDLGYDQFQGQVSPSLFIERKMAPEWSLGVGLRYSSMNITEVNEQRYGWYHSWYYQTLGSTITERDIQYKSVDADFVAKYYFLNSSLFQPYVGLGLGHSWGQIGYKNAVTTGGQEYRENASLSHFNGLAKVGVMSSFSKNWGWQIEGQAKQSLTQPSVSSDRKSSTPSENEQLIEQLGRDISTAPEYSLSTGLIFSF